MRRVWSSASKARAVPKFEPLAELELARTSRKLAYCFQSDSPPAPAAGQRAESLRAAA